MCVWPCAVPRSGGGGCDGGIDIFTLHTCETERRVRKSMMDGWELHHVCYVKCVRGAQTVRHNLPSSLSRVSAHMCTLYIYCVRVCTVAVQSIDQCTFVWHNAIYLSGRHKRTQKNQPTTPRSGESDCATAIANFDPSVDCDRIACSV